jgi:excisionase family DNA binding protein
LDELMTVKDTAGYLKLNYMTVYKLAHERKIPAFKVGGNWRFKKEILDHWLISQTQNGQGDILIVDDDPAVNDMLSEMIRGQGYNVFSVLNGEDALEALENHHFDLMFLDLILPGVSGIFVLESVKEKKNEVVVAIVTGHADESVTQQAMSLGPLFLVRKPFLEKDIVEVLNIVIKRKIRVR